jgi:hypothetical protein
MCQFSLADKTINFTKSATKFLPDLGQVFYFGVAALAAVFRFAKFAKRLDDAFRLNDGIPIFYYWFLA